MKHIYQYNLRTESADRLTELLKNLHMDFQMHELETMALAPKESVVVVDDASIKRHEGVFIFFGFSTHHDADCHLDPLDGKETLLRKLGDLFEGHYRSTTLIGVMNTGEIAYYQGLYAYLSSFEKRVLFVDLAYRSTAGTAPNFSKVLYCMEGGIDYGEFIETSVEKGIDVIASFDALADYRLVESVDLVGKLESLPYEYIFLNLAEQPTSTYDRLLERGWWINAIGCSEQCTQESPGVYQIETFGEMVLYHERSEG